MYSIGIDIGGTNLKAVALGADGTVLARQTAPTRDERAAVLEAVREVTRGFEAQFGAAPLGLAAPGMAARDGSQILYMTGWCEGLVGLEWAAPLGRSTPVPIMNDAHAHLLAESRWGAARGCRDALLLTLGTGVGGATLCDGKILKGGIGRAGHLGHVSLNPDGAGDIFNTPGSLEDAIGACRLKERSDGRFCHTVDLLHAAQNGDAHAQSIWDTSVKALAAAIASFINCFDPEVVILGGGVANAGAALFEPLQKHLDRFEWRPLGEEVPMVPAKLGDFAGAMGAALNAFELQGKPEETR